MALSVQLFAQLKPVRLVLQRNFLLQESIRRFRPTPCLSLLKHLTKVQGGCRGGTSIDTRLSKPPTKEMTCG